MLHLSVHGLPFAVVAYGLGILSKRCCMKIELKNIGKKCVVKLSTVLLALMMILLSFSFSFATYLPSDEYIKLCEPFNGTNTTYIQSVYDDTFIFACLPNGYSSWRNLVISKSHNYAQWSTYSKNNSNPSLGTALSLTYNSTYDFYYNSDWTTTGFWGVDASYGDKIYVDKLTGSVADILSQANAIVDSWSPPSAVGDGYLTNGLPVGNVIYFDIGSGVEYSIDLKSYFTSKSSWFGGSWVNDNRRYGFSDELPTTATNFSESSGSSIPWSPSGNTDLLGRSSEGSATISGTSTARYLWIVNPLYNLGYYDEPDKGSSLNGNIFYIGGISADTPYYLYSLKQSATSLGLSSDVASSVGGVGTVTTSGAINTVVNDGSGNEYTPPVGGDNSPPQEVTAAEGIKQTLDQFVNMFMNIFTAPISHIQQLISMGSEFISHLSGMWSWLPSEVSGFVTSAFVLLIVIGVIKLLI